MVSDVAPDVLLAKIFAITEKRANKSEKITDKKKRLDYINDGISEAINEYILEISKMSDKEFDELIKKRGNQLSITKKKLESLILNMMRDDKSVDMETLSTVAQSFNAGNLKLSPKSETMLNRKESSERLFALEFLGKLEMFFSLLILAFEQNSLYRLEEIIKRRFDSDIHWASAVSILAAHENLVKKKLIDLGMTEEQIEEFLKTKGQHFPNLVEHLSKLITEKEHRKVGLSFYKSSALREIRNKLEHEGYKQKIDKNDIDELLSDIEKFESEIFQDKKKTSLNSVET